MRYRANKKVSRWRQRQHRHQQDPHQKQYVPLPFGGGHNYRADRRCRKVNAGKIIRRNLPFIWNKIKDTAIPNSQDIQEISNSQRHANGTDSRQRHCLVSNIMLITLRSFSILRQEAWLRVYMTTLLWRWKCWIWRKLRSFETLSILRCACQKHYES